MQASIINAQNNIRVKTSGMQSLTGAGIAKMQAATTAAVSKMNASTGAATAKMQTSTQAATQKMVRQDFVRDRVEGENIVGTNVPLFICRVIGPFSS